MEKEVIYKNRINCWFIRSKEGENVLEMPDGQTTFSSEYLASTALSKYKHKENYFVIKGSYLVKSDGKGDKIRVFMEN